MKQIKLRPCRPRLTSACDRVSGRTPRPPQCRTDQPAESSQVKSSQVKSSQFISSNPLRYRVTKRKVKKNRQKHALKKVAIITTNKECLHKSRFNHAFTVSLNTHTHTFYISLVTINVQNFQTSAGESVAELPDPHNVRRTSELSVEGSATLRPCRPRLTSAGKSVAELPDPHNVRRTSERAS